MEQLENINFINGKWVNGNKKIIGPLCHGSWMGSPVFDGARSLKGYAPDLHEHCKRIIRSAKAMLMNPPVSADYIFNLAIEGIKKLGVNEDIYIRPLIWAEKSMGLLRCDPDSTNFCLSIIKMPMPKDKDFTACTTDYTRPTLKSAPTDAKAACLYPNGARAMNTASKKGYDNAVILDPNGNIAEFASSNLFIVKNGVVKTPLDNGTYLAGITRNTAIKLFSNMNIKVEEENLRIEDLYNADEILSTGNFGKIMFIKKLDHMHFNKCEFFNKLNNAYQEYSIDFKI